MVAFGLSRARPARRLRRFLPLLTLPTWLIACGDGIQDPDAAGGASSALDGAGHGARAGSGGANGSGGASGSGSSSSGGGDTGAGGAAPGSGGSSIQYPIELVGPPFTTKSDLFDQDDVNDLGLAKATGTETFTIFAPTSGSDHFSNGVALAAFKGYLYAQWQSSPTDEDSTDTWTAYSRSQDGETWSAPMVLAAKSTDQRSSGGFWVNGDTLVAYINVYPTSQSPRGGYTEFKTSTDGMNWSAASKLPMKGGGTLDGIFEQDPHALPDGRIISAAHFSPGLMVAPVYTDDRAGTSDWVRADFTNLETSGSVSREIEPSWFVRADGAIVMVFRDQSSTYKKLASMSGDRGETWTEPELTDMPDSRAKQSAGNLPDGTAYQVNCPAATNRRSPLAATLRRGRQVLRPGVPAPRGWQRSPGAPLRRQSQDARLQLPQVSGA